MIDLWALLIAAAIVGVVHMAAPDHWVTLCLMSKSCGWNNKKLFSISLMTSTGHAIFSAGLGFAVLAVGLIFSRLISAYVSFAIGTIMLATGMLIGIRSLTSQQKHVSPEGKLMKQEKNKNVATAKGISYFAILGAALSPDLSITPVFLAGVPAGLLFGVCLFGVFVISSILCQLVLVQVGARGFAKSLERVPEKYNDAIVGFAIVAIGIYIIVTA
jgi:nickel/cobalt transporter (NicO) family protein